MSSKAFCMMMQAFGKCELQKMLKLAMQLLVSDLQHQDCWSQAELRRLALHPSASAWTSSPSSSASRLRQKIKMEIAAQKHQNEAH